MSRRRQLMIGSGAFAAVAAIALTVGIWYAFYRDDAPAPVSIGDAVGSVSTAVAATMTVTAESRNTSSGTETSTLASGSSATSPARTATTTESAESRTPVTEPSGISGAWSVADESDSFVGYRVGEELSGIGTTEAVGRTSAVQGTVVIDGQTVTSASFEADVTQLQSDDERRDRTLGRQALESTTYPTASFQLTEPATLPEVPQEGVTFSIVARGELTIHGVTQTVDLPLQGQLSKGFLVVVGTSEIVLSDFDIDPPSAPLVLAVNDYGTLEFQIVLARE